MILFVNPIYFSSCSGDFILDHQPTTYNESVRTYKNLTQQLGKAPEYERAAKMEMTLTPLKMLCGKGEAMLVAISEGLLNGVSKMLDELEQTALKVSEVKDVFYHTRNYFRDIIRER